MGKIAIVTGASSGIGERISVTLCNMGFEVYGFGREFQQESVLMKESFSKRENGCFHAMVCNLLETEDLLKHIGEIKAKGEVCVLVNNAGVGFYGLHEELNPKKIQTMLRTNLEVPMILSNVLLRELKKNAGTIINVSSITASQSNPHGCAYGASKAGLTSFSHSLFEEARKYGVRVVNIQPDMTQTNLYRNADFQEGEEEQSYLLPEEVAQAVEFILSQRQGLVVTDLSLRPQLHRIQRKKKS